MNGRYLLDTNIIAAIWKQEARVIEGIKTAKAVFIPSIVIAGLFRIN
jgi:predicted nucleic acid-binding protein